jgi:hypothetical protein
VKTLPGDAANAAWIVAVSSSHSSISAGASGRTSAQRKIDR